MRRRRAKSGRARGTPRRCPWRMALRSRLPLRRARCRGRPRCRPHMCALGRRPGSAPGLGALQSTRMARAGTWFTRPACALPRHAAASKLTCAAFAAGAGSARRSRATTETRASARAGHLPAPAVPAAAAAAAARRLRSARGAIGAPGVLAADRRLAAPAAMARCRASFANVADLRAASAAAEQPLCWASSVWIGTLLVQ